MLLKCKNLIEKRYFSRPNHSAQQQKQTRPSYYTRMGSKPSNHNLGWQGSPETHPARAKTGPRISPPSISRSTVSIPPGVITQNIRRDTLKNPRPVHFFLPHRRHNTAQRCARRSVGGGYGRRRPVQHRGELPHLQCICPFLASHQN
jgi:hypothetical protein